MPALTLPAFKRKLIRVLRAAAKSGIVVSKSRARHGGRVCCPLGAHPELRLLAKPSPCVASESWGVTYSAAYQFIAGFDGLTSFGNPASPYYKLGQSYGERFP